jgi:shikimate dehydrogenase
MRQFGLIGNPVAHSLSPEYFSRKWENEGIQDCDYRLFPLQSLRELPELLEANQGLRGLNVTSPFKQEALSVADEVDETALCIGSANVLSIDNRQRITAYNTDHIGFDRILEQIRPLPEAALICGSGGAAKAVRYSLERHGVRTTVASRHSGTDRIRYDAIDTDIMQQHTLIVNATPLGMGSHIGECPPLPYQALTPNHIMADLNYLPAETLFLQKGKEMGCRCLNGLDMLQGQADAAWEIWEKATESFNIHI